MSILDKLCFWRKKPIIEFDDNGRTIYSRDVDGFEKRWTRNSNGKVIHLIDSRGYEREWKYDENGEMFSYRESTGYEWFSDKRYKILFRQFDLPE